MKDLYSTSGQGEEQTGSPECFSEETDPELSVSPGLLSEDFRLQSQLRRSIWQPQASSLPRRSSPPSSQAIKRLQTSRIAKSKETMIRKLKREQSRAQNLTLGRPDEVKDQNNKKKGEASKQRDKVRVHRVVS